MPAAAAAADSELVAGQDADGVCGGYREAAVAAAVLLRFRSVRPLLILLPILVQVDLKRYQKFRI